MLQVLNSGPTKGPIRVDAVAEPRSHPLRCRKLRSLGFGRRFCSSCGWVLKNEGSTLHLLFPPSSKTLFPRARIWVFIRVYCILFFDPLLFYWRGQSRVISVSCRIIAWRRVELHMHCVGSAFPLVVPAIFICDALLCTHWLCVSRYHGRPLGSWPVVYVGMGWEMETFWIFMMHT
jgi:hypothetical protein